MADLIRESNLPGVAHIKEGVSEACDVLQAVDLERGLHERVGHVTALTVAGATLTGDLRLEDPSQADTETMVTVIGVIDTLDWAGGRRDPIELTCWISAANWQKIAQVEHKEDDGAEDDEEYAECAFAFTVYDYDSLAKAVYKSFHTAGVSVKGLFRFDGSDIVVGRTPHEGVKSPQLYKLTLNAKPKPPQQDLHIGLAAKATQTKPWGDAAVESSRAREKRELERVSRKAREKKQREEEERAKAEARDKDKNEAAEAARREKEAREREAREREEQRRREEALKAKSEALLAKAEELSEKARRAQETADEVEAARLATESVLAEERLRENEELRAAEDFARREGEVEEKYRALRRAEEEARAKAIEAARKAYEAAETAALESEVLLAETAAAARIKSPRSKEAIALEEKIMKSRALRTTARFAHAKEGEAREAAHRERLRFLEDEERRELVEIREEKSERLRRFESSRRAAFELNRALQEKALLSREEESRRRSEEKEALRAAEEARTEAEVAKAAKEEAQEVERALAAAAEAERAAKRARRLADDLRASVESRANRIKALERELATTESLVAALAQRARRREFRQDMAIQLKLTLGGQAVEVPGGAVSSWSLSLETWGYTGEIEFVVTLDSEKDTLNAKFTGTGIAEIELSIASKFQPTSGKPDPLVVKGVVLERRVVEDTFDALSVEKILRRRYRMTFADPAWALLRQHFPCELVTDQTLQEVIDAHKTAKVALTGDWPAVLGLARPFVFLGLDARPGGASFYDWLIWTLDRSFGVLLYDATANEYSLLPAKADGGTPLKLDADDVERIQVSFPEVPRHAARVLNAAAEAAIKTSEIAFDDAVTGIRRDHLVRTGIAKEFEAKGTLETARLVPRKPELRLRFMRFPTITLRPGIILDLSSASFGADVFAKSKTYRVRSYALVARSAAAPDKAAEKLPTAEFTIEATAVLEEAKDVAPHLPPYTRPEYPRLVEGKIVAAGGEDDDRMWLVADDKKTSISSYTVDIPLWNKKIPALFVPNHFPGHFFFPAYKHERVVIALDLHAAEIARFLDWAPKGRLPLDTQGNHILLGKKDKNETSISHVYVDAKPVLKIHRDKAGDTQTITIEDGKLHILVQADDQGAAPPPKFDVTMQVEQSKGETKMAVGGALADFSGEFTASLAGPNAALADTKTEVEGALGDAQSQLAAKAGEVRAGVEGALAGLEGGAAKLDAAAGEAIAELEGLL